VHDAGPRADHYVAPAIAVDIGNQKVYKTAHIQAESGVFPEAAVAVAQQNDPARRSTRLDTKDIQFLVAVKVSCPEAIVGWKAGNCDRRQEGTITLEN
jgi:hypothetical protein